MAYNGPYASVDFQRQISACPIVLIAAIDNSTYQSKLQDWGYVDVKVFNQTFTGDRLVEQIGSLPKIATMDYIGHNGVLYGLAFENYEIYSMRAVGTITTKAVIQKEQSTIQLTRVLTVLRSTANTKLDAFA